jgi:CheY-like chemotaxis protein/signal transduction histidine kinase
MNLIRNLKIRDKLLLLFFFLLIPLLYFVITGTMEVIKQKEELSNFYMNQQEAELITTLIHELQNERALSNGFIASKGIEFRKELLAQRQLTDQARIKLQEYLEDNKREVTSLSLFNNQAEIRTQTDQSVLDSVRQETFYSEIREGLMLRVSRMSAQMNDEEIRSLLLAHISLLTAKHGLGRLRALSNKILVNNKLSVQDYKTFGTYKAFYEQDIQSFARNASPEMLEAHKKVIATENFREVIRLLDLIDQNPQTNLASLDGKSWYQKFTAAIGGMRQVEVLSIGTIQSMMLHKIAANNRLLLFYIFFVLLSLALAIIVAAFIIRFVSDAILNLRNASEKLNRGNTDVAIIVNSTDELGDLARSFSKLAANNQQLANVAEAIGQGHYDVQVELKGPQDVLGNSLNTMRQRLKTLSLEQENRNWMMAGISGLNDLITGASNIEQTAAKVTTYLCEYLQAQAGVFYINNDRGAFAFCAGYAVHNSSLRMPEFKIGEGLSGQAVEQRKILFLDNVPSQHLSIRTGMAEVPALQIMIVPLYYNDEVLGLVELASKNIFVSRQRQFMEETATRIALVLHNLIVNQKTQELLHETQNQSEELAAQQEELRQVNTELKEQKEQLVASEEELRVSQEELQEKNQELEEQYEAIQIKNKEIEDARQAIELKIQQVETVSRYKSEFLANMSHELRTPLNSIMILSSLLAEDMEKRGLDKLAEHSRIINNSGSDLLKLINEILDLAKIESGQVNLEIKEVEISKLNAGREFTQLAKEKNIDFQVHISQELPATITTDAFRLEQILKNLLSNAFKFTSAGGKVSLHMYKPHTTIFRSSSLNDASGTIAFAVTDTGIGIPQSKQALVFEAFQQADTSTTRKYGGTGLGLSICRELAGLLGGEIHLESEEGKGSTFTLFLPLHLGEEDTMLPVSRQLIQMPLTREQTVSMPAPMQTQDTVAPFLEQMQLPKNGKSKKIVVVEDDHNFNHVLADFARSKNFQVWQAFTGTEGWELIKKHKPDAVLLDIQLPGINGWDILKMMREDSRLKGIQVHVMSAYDRQTVEGNLAGEEFIAKPLTLEKIDKAFAKIAGSNNHKLKNILVIEDNQIENQAIAELLASHNIQSSAAFSGTEALNKLKTEEIDGIILDLKLPDMEGYQVMEKIRATIGAEDLPIIIYSGKDLSMEEENKLLRYANTVIIKNEFSYLRLMDEVKLFLQKVNENLRGKGEKDSASAIPPTDLHVPGEVLQHKKVLIVDDDVRNIYSLYTVLERQGMQIVIANDGKEALEKLQEEKDMDIVLMDTMMPEMDGIECTKRIRQQNQFKSLPVIALTAKAMKGDREKCMEAGASDYISKPLDIDKLLSLMRVWVYDRNKR